MSKFLLALITINKHTVFKDAKLKELEKLKKEYCSKAKLMDDVYGTRLNELMVVENKRIKRRINLIKTRRIIHKSMENKIDNKL